MFAFLFFSSSNISTNEALTIPVGTAATQLYSFYIKYLHDNCNSILLSLIL